MFNDSKPQDFEKSEQIVVIGKVVGDEFRVAKGDLLMKFHRSTMETNSKSK